MKKLFFKAEKTENERLDVFLAGAAEGLSRAHALKLIEAGNVNMLTTIIASVMIILAIM